MAETVALTERAEKLLNEIQNAQPITPPKTQVVEEALECLYSRLMKK